MHSYVEYDSVDGLIKVGYGSGYRSAILMTLDTNQRKTLDMYFSHSQAKSVSPLEVLYEYTGVASGPNVNSFFQIKH